jgi:UPF0755 protein
MAKNKKTSGLNKFFIAFFLLLFIGGGFFGYDYYKRIYRPNVAPGLKWNTFLYIRTGSVFEDVLSELQKQHMLINTASFEWLAERMKYKQKIVPGKYRVLPGMSNKQLISLLRSGKQEPVKVVFNSIRTRQQLAGRIGQQVEADSLSMLNEMKNDSLLEALQLTPENSMILFIPNTYEMYWNTSAKQFMERMAKEYKKFWNKARMEKLDQLGLSQAEASVLASIVQQESNKKDEKPTIAGVYLNRLKTGCLLEADPTLVFACGDFTIKRVLNVHKQIDSPYNTYKYKGLPPGPICLPTAASIDAVLNYKKHNFIYFCAKEDLSGYHNFAVTLSQHIANANKFHRELNRRQIK